VSPQALTLLLATGGKLRASWRDGKTYAPIQSKNLAAGITKFPTEAALCPSADAMPFCYPGPMWDQIIVVNFIALGALAVLTALRRRRTA